MEKRTAGRLKAMGIECYLPVQSEWRQWSDRRKRVDRLVIPLVVFVRVSPAERPLPLTLSAVSRYLVLRGEHVPAVIPDQQMERFRFMLEHSQQSVKITDEPLAPGTPVRVVDGPLAGLEGEFLTVKNQSTIAIRIDLLGCVYVDISPDWVEKIQK